MKMLQPYAEYVIILLETLCMYRCSRDHPVTELYLVVV